MLEILEAGRKVTGKPLDVKIGPRRPGDPPALFARADRAEQELGWKPSRTDIETIVEHAWRALRS